MYRKRKPKPDLQKILTKLRDKRNRKPVVVYAARDIQAARKILMKLRKSNNTEVINKISSIKIESKNLEEPSSNGV